MKPIFITAFLFMIFIYHGQTVQSDTIRGSSNYFFSTDTCIHLIYATMGGWKNKKIDYYDTTSILRISDWQDYKRIEYNKHGELLFRHDSVFYKDYSWTGEYASLLYWSAKTLQEKPIVLGGDGIAGVQFSEPIGYYRLGSTVYADCYKFTRQMESTDEIIVCKGLGAISITGRDGYKVLVSIEKKKNCP